jgi:hypothetical protein
MEFSKKPFFSDARKRVCVLRWFLNDVLYVKKDKKKAKTNRK